MEMYFGVRDGQKVGQPRAIKFSAICLAVTTSDSADSAEYHRIRMTHLRSKHSLVYLVA